MGNSVANEESRLQEIYDDLSVKLNELNDKLEILQMEREYITEEMLIISKMLGN